MIVVDISIWPDSKSHSGLDAGCLITSASSGGRLHAAGCRESNANPQGSTSHTSCSRAFGVVWFFTTVSIAKLSIGEAFSKGGGQTPHYQPRDQGKRVKQLDLSPDFSGEWATSWRLNHKLPSFFPGQESLCNEHLVIDEAPLDNLGAASKERLRILLPVDQSIKSRQSTGA